MPSKKVLILESDLLLSAGLENLLLGQKNLDVHGVTCSNVGELNAAINQIQPDIIIADTTYVTVTSGEVLNYLKMHPGVKTILINLEDNQIEVYDNKRIFIREIGDFLTAFL
jgi:DNA-binding NarL/FixJ family response regulator